MDPNNEKDTQREVPLINVFEKIILASSEIDCKFIEINVKKPSKDKNSN